MSRTKRSKAELQLAWEKERTQECQCRACTALRYEHVDVHLRENKPSPWCYQCRTDFTKEEIAQALTQTRTSRMRDTN